MWCIRRMGERGALNVRRTSQSKKVPQITVHRGPQQKTGEKGGLERMVYVQGPVDSATQVRQLLVAAEIPRMREAEGAVEEHRCRR